MQVLLFISTYNYHGISTCVMFTRAIDTYTLKITPSKCHRQWERKGQSYCNIIRKVSTKNDTVYVSANVSRQSLEGRVSKFCRFMPTVQHSVLITICSHEEEKLQTLESLWGKALLILRYEVKNICFCQRSFYRQAPPIQHLTSHN